MESCPLYVKYVYCLAIAHDNMTINGSTVLGCSFDSVSCHRYSTTKGYQRVDGGIVVIGVAILCSGFVGTLCARNSSRSVHVRSSLESCVHVFTGVAHGTTVASHGHAAIVYSCHSNVRSYLVDTTASVVYTTSVAIFHRSAIFCLNLTVRGGDTTYHLNVFAGAIGATNGYGASCHGDEVHHGSWAVQDDGYMIVTSSHYHAPHCAIQHVTAQGTGPILLQRVGQHVVDVCAFGGACLTTNYHHSYSGQCCVN